MDTPINPEPEVTVVGAAPAAVGLSFKERAFCLRYVKDFNGTQSYKEIFGEHIKDASAAVMATRLLASHKVKTFLAGLVKTRFDRLGEEANAAIDAVVARAFFDPTMFMRIDESGQPVLDLTKAKAQPEMLRHIKFKFGVSVTKTGEAIPTYDVEAYDSADALKELFKLHKLVSDAPSENQRPIELVFNFPAPGSERQTTRADAIDAGGADEA